MNRELAKMHKRSMQKINLAKSILNENTTKLVTGFNKMADAEPTIAKPRTEKEQT